MGNVKKKDGLLVRFAVIFLIFTLAALTFSAFATYNNQNDLYK